ncbi:receptor-type tyrosine-protein phosphatase O-like [Sinocyclocheilus rhinocerous]|uniref:receptor-type tyrosine-protein phosphatase O-like n=1 Tax=Sinocyclocheilus rhinocerous TaxID=307959 RepID=UPI0007BA14C9|nr:PREDICTED: receptor-type tyrosine-protein phosphatase O-like [Sinocyclocheilus rhinocerous]
MSSALRWVLSLCFIITIIVIQRGAPFQVALQDDHRMLLSLDADDVRPDASVYSVRVSGEPHTHTLLFTRPADGQTLPHPLQFNASYHGLCYSISLMLGNDSRASRAVRTVPVLTKPLPLDSIEMSDYSPAPETGVVFQIRSPDRNIYTRVNISYMEGRQPRYMLYKDFLKGKTVFKHWLSGTCYTNISFQLVSEATVNRSTLVSRSDVTHEPLRHRTVPNPPLNVSLKIIHLSGRGASHNASVLRRARDVPAAEEQEEEVNGVEMSVTQTPLNNVTVYSSTAEPNSTELLWAELTGSPAPTEEQEEEFVNVLVPEYEDSNEPGSAMDVTFEPSVMPKPLPPILLELRWLPPRPPTAYDGFNIYIHRDGNSTKTVSVDENITSDIISSLTPGAQYRVMAYHTNGPLVSPPSEPVIIDIDEIAATASVIASVRVTDLLPAWFYNFRVTMVTWGDPPLSCCDASTVSFVTAPEAPHISSVDYAHGTLFVRWTYGDLFTDLSHSRMLHWQLTAEGKKGARRHYSIDVTRNMMKASLTLPPGDIYNLTVSACTEKSRNTSAPHIIKLEPAPPKSLYALNATDTAVTLLWTEDGVVDFYQIICRPLRVNRESKKVREPLLTTAHVVTVSGLQPSTSYNCTVISSSYSSVSDPAYITVSTTVREMNPSVAAISALAVLSVLLIILLVLFLLVLRKKHMELSRECGAETFVNFASFERDGKLPYNWRRSLFAFLTLLPSCLWTDYLLAFYINPWSKTALKKRKLTSPVQLSDFDAYIKDMSKDSAYKFSLQFEELKSIGLDLSHEAADLPVNRPKNRYTNILPYDFSRVKLISLHNDEGSDYINANFIPGYNSTHEFIATQGPLPETRNDFWKMVLQQKSHIVVMLTQCNERRRVKCDHYWPFTEEPVAYGEITVEMLSETDSPEWTVRNFRLGYADETQDVLHFNYTSWPDHGVPTVNAIESILQFVQIVRQQVNRTKGPIVVHCSAGVGRTGTFIALDRLMQHIQEHEYVDVLGLVSDMRSHRLSMVQTEEQYVFIHQCVLLMWKKKKQQTHTSDVIYENVSKS